MRKYNVFCRELGNTPRTKDLQAFFFVRRKPVNFSHPAHSIIYDLDIHNDAVAPKNSMKQQCHHQNHSYHDIMIMIIGNVVQY